MVESIDALMAEVFTGSYDRGLGRYRSPFAFRGMCGDWDLSTSLQRLRHPLSTLKTIERVMFRNFRKYAYHEAVSIKSEWEWLSLAQHHGLPTRLLDWTFSPFVAMHFATNELDKMDTDGVVWMVDFIASREFLPDVLSTSLRKNAANGFNVELLEGAFPKISDVELHKGGMDAFAVFFEPPSLDPRIINQFGLFSFLNRPDTLLNEWLEQACTRSPGLARKLIIPARLKWELRDKLDQMNMTERVLMPGLDGLSAWLKRWYSPGSPRPVGAPVPPKRATTKGKPPSSRV
ncbi:MAG TPA: FRG domain-containing protein [Verrucomicrobiae bacterium]|nr:FRG domain-containing protein [Verrucomicrobiae bacterium]